LALALGACGGRSTVLSAPRPLYLRPSPDVAVDTIGGRYSGYAASSLAWIGNDSLWFEQDLLVFYKPMPRGEWIGYSAYGSFVGALTDTALALVFSLGESGAPFPDSLGVVSGGATWRRVGDSLYVEPRLSIAGGSWPAQTALSYAALERER
jgi:hypothetical protein